MSPPRERSILIRNVVIGIAVVAVIVILVRLWTRGREEADPAPREPVVLSPVEQEATEDRAAGPAGPADSGASARTEQVRRWTDVMGRPPVWPENLAGSGRCEEVRADLARVCAALDVAAPTLREAGGSCTLVEQVGAELAARPPDLTSELRSYDTLLENVFYLFRMVGRERMGALRTALRSEKLAEPAALALYRWSLNHERCAAGEGDAIDRDVRYAYAGFLFHTMGGQAYLRRRSPRTEALACFYALETLDAAIREGHNPAGIDPRPEFARCRDLVSSQPLLFSSEYAARLDEMARRWKNGPG